MPKCVGKTSCGLEKPLTDFYCYNGKYKKNCKKCLSKYAQNFNEKRRNNGYDLTEYNRRHAIKRMKKPLEVIMSKVRRRIYSIMKEKNYIKSKHCNEILGCSYEDYHKWIIFNLELDCYEEYHIDHVIPLSSGETIEQVLELSKWYNTIPTTPKYNLEKHARLPNKHELFKLELRLKLFKNVKKI